MHLFGHYPYPSIMDNSAEQVAQEDSSKEVKLCTTVF